MSAKQSRATMAYHSAVLSLFCGDTISHHSVYFTVIAFYFAHLGLEHCAAIDIMGL